MVSYRSLTDMELAELLWLGDSEAFAEIYERYFNVLYIHAYKRLNDKDGAKDIVQDMFTYIWKNRNAIKLQSNVAGYLYAGIRNRVLNALAQKKYASLFADGYDDFVLEAIETDHRIREKQLIEIIEIEIHALPPRMREVFELSRKQHYTHREIAAQLNLTEQSVRSHVKGALRLLRAKLTSFFFYFF